MKTLHLNLKKNWFDMIKSGEKKEEYREITPYWCTRFLLFLGKKKSMEFWKSKSKVVFDLHSYVKHGIKVGVIKFINHAWWPYNQVNICFSNGYAKDRDQFTIGITGMKFNSQGNPNWGAIPGEKYFVLELGEILKTKTR